MRLSGTNIEHTRSFNRRVVLEAVRRHGPISRAEIARLTSLSPQTVSNIALELRESGLIRAEGRRRAARGQPPVELSIDPAGGYTVGLQLDHARLSGVLVNLAGTVCGRTVEPIATPEPATAMPRLAAAVEALIDGAEVPRTRVLGCGVVMPGPFDVETLSSVGPTTLPGWHGIDVAGRLTAATGLPVLVENDATAAALGERLHGAARDLRTFFYLYLGVGLGAGLILDGQPYRGAWGNAGEFGHIVVAPDGAPCFCGNNGCLERYASLHAAFEAMRAAGKCVGTTADLAALAAAGDPAMTGWLDSAARHLRIALNAVENLLDPEAVLIGGDLPDRLAEALIDRLTPLPPSVSARRDRHWPRLIRATAGAEATALGAAALPLFDSVSPSFSLLVKNGARSAPEESAAALAVAP
ncbi:MAG: ROK family transcriptional regulator [Inquilinus sp.]|nr:ROK family transcriptional regulator [Inquilinus sp.]